MRRTQSQVQISLRVRTGFGTRGGSRMFGRTLVDRANVKQFCGFVWRNIRFYTLADNLSHASSRHLQHSSNKQQPTNDNRQTTADVDVVLCRQWQQTKLLLCGCLRGSSSSSSIPSSNSSSSRRSSNKCCGNIGAGNSCCLWCMTSCCCVYRSLQQRSSNSALTMSARRRRRRRRLHCTSLPPLHSPPCSCYICQSVSRQRPAGIVALSAYCAIFISRIHMAHIC